MTDSENDNDLSIDLIHPGNDWNRFMAGVRYEPSKPRPSIGKSSASETE
jgi:hypothetical protein